MPSFKVICFSVAAVVAAFAAPAIAKDVTPEQPHMKYGEKRAYFKHVLAACRPTGFCSVTSYNNAGPDAAGVDSDYLIRIASPAENAPYEVIFTGVASYFADDTDVEFWIDGRKIAIAPSGGGEAGWRNVDRVVNEYIFGSKLSAPLVKQMKAGSQLRVRFQSKKGADRDIQLSLIGLTSALTWIETVRFGPNGTQ